MNLAKSLFRRKATLLNLCAIISLAACNLNRNPIVWIHDVQPQFVCPGDSVTLSWDGGDESTGASGCLGDACDAVTVDISSNPADVINPPLAGLRSHGEIFAGPITSNTTFTFSATGGRDTRSPGTHVVDVVLPDRVTNVPLNFRSACSGAATVWRDADLSSPSFRSPGVRLVRVCNTTRDQIRLTIAFDSSRSWVLLPGACTEDLPEELGRNVYYASAGLLFPGGAPSAHCDISLGDLPPDINLTATLACDMMTASEPIVIASPESSTPEGTDSGIIPLWTETPASAGFILIIQVPANCRQGPDVAYPVVNSALPGEQIEVVGKSADGTWWYGKVDNDQCFISNIAGTPSGDLNLLTIIQAPPTPIPTKTEVPQQQEQPTAITEIDFDQDGYGISADCNDKNAAIHPGAVETPDDKVDSNCNGDDDK